MSSVYTAAAAAGRAEGQRRRRRRCSARASARQAGRQAGHQGSCVHAHRKFAMLHAGAMQRKGRSGCLPPTCSTWPAHAARTGRNRESPRPEGWGWGGCHCCRPPSWVAVAACCQAPSLTAFVVGQVQDEPDPPAQRALLLQQLRNRQAVAGLLGQRPVGQDVPGEGRLHWNCARTRTRHNVGGMRAGVRACVCSGKQRCASCKLQAPAHRLRPHATWAHQA